MSDPLSVFMQMRAGKQNVPFDQFLADPTTHADDMIARSRRPRSNRPTFNPETALGEQDPALNRGPLGFIEQDPAGFAKGVASAPFTAAPDLLSIGAEGMNFLSRSVGGALGIPTTTFEGSRGGDPIRELIGLDPESGPGILGEVVSPVNTMAKALGVSAKAVVAGAKIAAGTGFDPSLAMTLFHGTPHKFNKFDLSAIGTGEGAQAFGHGLYFAENPGVARSYRNNVSNHFRFAVANAEINGKGAREFINSLPSDDGEILDSALTTISEGINRGWFDNLDFDSPQILDEIKNQIRFSVDDPINGLHGFDGEPLGITAKKADEVISQLETAKFKPEPGHLYEVDIPDETVARMLDWDAPLSEQPESVQAALGAWFDTGSEVLQPEQLKTTGDSLYKQLSRRFGGDEQASRFLSELGIPGIRYFDGGSRGAGDGTRNIVVFNPDDIRQVKRDGELVFQK